MIDRVAYLASPDKRFWSHRLACVVWVSHCHADGFVDYRDAHGQPHSRMERLTDLDELTHVCRCAVRQFAANARTIRAAWDEMDADNRQDALAAAGQMGAFFLAKDYPEWRADDALADDTGDDDPVLAALGPAPLPFWMRPLFCFGMAAGFWLGALAMLAGLLAFGGPAP